ncbi:MAG TPA: hypothetical protein VND64_03810 [Pirellulales bacterium]|nr:hypothetical protein [Pirellulales bacterium]
MWLLAEIEFAKIICLSMLVLTCGWLLVRTYRQPSRATRPARDSSSAGLDDKIDVLQRLIGEADQRIAWLEALNDRAARLTAGEPSSSPPFHPDARPADHEAPRWGGAKIGLRVDAPVHHTASPAARRHEEIYALADSGLASAAIATRIGSPVGEIELILGLRQTRG